MFEPIGTVRSCFKERFGIPRQAGLVPSACAEIVLNDEAVLREGLRGLEGFSHIWVLFAFHDAVSEGWRPFVRPPRLGGDRKVGVFATRSPHRPNAIGMSAVRLERIEGARLFLSGVDILDGTPVLDIKPYVAYADAISSARAGWAEGEIPRLEVEIPPLGQSAEFERLMRETLALDPRPAHQASEGGEYAVRLGEHDVHWQVRGRVAFVTRVDAVCIKKVSDTFL